ELLATEDVDECVRFAETRQVSWIHVTGLHDPDKISRLGKAFKIHPLILEDILHTDGRPKIEEQDKYVFVVSKLLYYDSETHVIDVQQFSLLLLPDSSVITFLESPSPVFDPVLERIRTGGGGRIRRFGPDYLTWALLDIVVDHYFKVVDGVEETLDELEDRFEADPNSLETRDLYLLKKEVTALHRLVRPMREIATILNRSDSSLLTTRTLPYFRDLYDHAVHVLEEVETLRDSASSLRDFFLSQVSNRMNEVMKVLTCFATIFLPLTFLAGIYGMNFKYMPELHWRWAYPALWVVFVAAAGGMFWYFRRRRWL
ncbi:MAG: magnesium/cobalt transporter CorA, partial [Verrucomicrobiae bacterium]|nr:magnesium/cobalt transporter CorA [Verrucomicrobiae bacterium]